jgi:hypothetical protein
MALFDVSQTTARENQGKQEVKATVPFDERPSGGGE